VKKGVGGSAVLSLGTIQRSFGGVPEYLCAFFGSSVSSLYATWAVPAGVGTPAGNAVTETV